MLQQTRAQPPLGRSILLHSHRVQLTFRDPVAWTMDGEGAGKQRSVLCENIPHAVRMIVSEDI